MSSESNQISDSKPEKASNDKNDWYAECSDEEVYTKGGYIKGKMSAWEPDPKAIVELYQAIDKNGAESIQLEWTCPGRRPLTPSTESEYSDSDDEAAKNSAKAALDFEFDANEDLNVTPTLASARKSLPGSAKRELTGSARKRTTDYRSILSNLERQRKIDEAEKAAASTPTGPPSQPK